MLPAMEICFNLARFLEKTIIETAHNLPEFDTSFIADIRPSDPRHGDYQANGILPLAKKNKCNPRELANKVLKHLQENPNFDATLISTEIAGPGFLNFKLSPHFLLKWLQRYHDESSFHQAAGDIYHGKRISVDYSSPNTAKQMHVGHIRSMVVGEAIQRLLKFCGANVIRDNHIGDWGTQFGILILAIKKYNYDLDANAQDPLEDLEDLYRKGRALYEESEAGKEAARQELAKLQKKDPENFALWEKIIKVSYDAFDEIYKLLGIEFDVVYGESYYHDKVDRIYKELIETGIAIESEGALVVFHPNPNAQEEPYPFIIRKKDGSSNYATTDLACILNHVENTQVEEMIYVTDGRQQDHFKHLFKTAEQWFTAKGYKLPTLHHAWFGMILGEDGKAIKTRSGDPIKLKALLQEGIERAYKIVEEKNPSLSDKEKKHIAKVVGLGAIRYADLVHNRSTDYVFSWDKTLAFDGNTAPYLLYAIARIHSIFRKAGLKPGASEEEATTFETETELTLARKIIEFPLILDKTITDLRPHTLCTYLYELAGLFSSFYNADKVLGDNKAIQARRLLLCNRTLKTLETGLHLLGLETLESM